MSNSSAIPQEDKDFGYWGVDFQAYANRAKELGLFLDRRPVCPSQALTPSGHLLGDAELWQWPIF